MSSILDIKASLTDLNKGFLPALNLFVYFLTVVDNLDTLFYLSFDFSLYFFFDFEFYICLLFSFFPAFS